MALPSSYGINKTINSMEGLSAYENGGKGSGNFGHSGRPGEKGGSGNGQSSSTKDSGNKTSEDTLKKLSENLDIYDKSDKGTYTTDQFSEASTRLVLKDLKDRGLKKEDVLKVRKEVLEAKEKGGKDYQIPKDKMEDYLLGNVIYAKSHPGSYKDWIADRWVKIIDNSPTVYAIQDLVDYLSKKKNSLELNGGKGSGNFGHGGRPGKVGGSGRSSYPHNLEEAKKKEKEAEKEFSDYVESHKGIDYDQKIADKLGAKLDDAKEWRQDYEQKEAYKKMEEKGKKEPKTQTVSLKGKSLYEKVHMIEPGDTVYIKPQDNLPNFDKKIKVDYIQDGTIHYGATETSDGYTYPAWAIKDITKIERKNGLELNGGPGSGNFGHAGRPGQIGGSGKGSGIEVHSGSDEMDYYYAEDGDRVLASGKTEKEALEKAKKKLAEEKKASWDEPYKEFTKTDQIGVGDYGEAGFFTTGNFAVDTHLDAKDVVDSVKDYNIINDMIFEAETRDRLASTPEGIRIEGLITDLKGELHAQNVYSSATFETSDIRRKILLQTAASVASIRDKLEDARGIDRYDKYIDKAVDIAKKTERRATTAANKSYDEWQTHKTAKPQIAGGSAKSDRPMTKAYDDYQIEKQRKRGSDLAYAFSR